MFAKIVTLILLIAVSTIQCSIVPAAPALRYSLVTPHNIRPFAAQVSTFTRGLDVFAAPYAAGVLSHPAIVARAAPLAAPAVLPAPAAVAAPHFHAAYAPAYAPGFAPAAYAGPAAFAPAPAALAAPVPFLPEHYARSVHAAAPAFEPAYPHAHLFA